MEEELFKLGEPTFYLIQTNEDKFANIWLQLIQKHKEAVIRMVRGRKSIDVCAFFDEISAVLQFPYYFGENWNAFDECITDLDWLEGNAYLLMVSSANLLLSDADAEDFALLTRSLSVASKAWLTPNQYIPRTRQPTPFHVLFQCEASEALAFTQKLTDQGVNFEMLQLPN